MLADQISMKFGRYTKGTFLISSTLSAEKEKAADSATKLSLTISWAITLCFLSLAMETFRDLNHLWIFARWGLVGISYHFTSAFVASA